MAACATRVQRVDRVTRLRRLRIRKAARWSTFTVGVIAVALSIIPFGTFRTSASGPPRRGSNPAAAKLPDVGVWVAKGSSPAQLELGSFVEAFASAISAGSSPAVSIRAVVMGKVHDVFETAVTAGELLSAMGITADARDRVPPPPHPRSTTGSESGSSNYAVVRDASFGLVVHPADAGEPGDSTASGRLHTQVGEASWYDAPGVGFTAASPWLPFGTRVTVTNLDTRESVVVVIDDRGPFGGRIIDLSPEAFSALSSLGRGVISARLAW